MEEKIINKLTPEIVGHVPKKISRAVFYFLSKRWKMVGRVFNEKFYPSPIPKVGLEIILMVQFRISEEKRKYIDREK